MATVARAPTSTRPSLAWAAIYRKGGDITQPPLRLKGGRARAMNTGRPVLSPAQQDTVMFYGHEIIAVRLADGRIAASLRNMCEALQVDRYGQVRRIREDETISDQLVQVTIQTEGGAQS